MDIKFIKLQSFGDDRGALVALEQGRNIPFEIKRVYYLFDTKKDVIRGMHAHKDLKQVVIALKGHCTFILDDGTERIDVKICDPEQGLLLESCVWREMHGFSEDCVLMVLASDYYDEADYIRNYTEFLKGVNNAEK
jgi:dTDP-4-dehydrorhamnose 3,5-epimerase-like enzyme